MTKNQKTSHTRFSLDLPDHAKILVMLSFPQIYKQTIFLIILGICKLFKNRNVFLPGKELNFNHSYVLGIMSAHVVA